MDEASKVLENLKAFQPRLPTGYQKLSPNPPLTDDVIHLNLVNPTLSERESHESIPNQTSIEKMIDLIPPLGDCTFLVESGID